MIIEKFVIKMVLFVFLITVHPYFLRKDAKGLAAFPLLHLKFAIFLASLV